MHGDGQSDAGLDGFLRVPHAAAARALQLVLQHVAEALGWVIVRLREATQGRDEVLEEFLGILLSHAGELRVATAQ